MSGVTSAMRRAPGCALYSAVIVGSSLTNHTTPSLGVLAVLVAPKIQLIAAGARAVIPCSWKSCMSAVSAPLSEVFANCNVIVRARRAWGRDASARLLPSISPREMVSNRVTAWVVLTDPATTNSTHAAEANSLLRDPPAEKRAISTPSNESSSNNCTGQGRFRKLNIFPTERSEASSRRECSGNSRDSNSLINSVPNLEASSSRHRNAR